MCRVTRFVRALAAACR